MNPIATALTASVSADAGELETRYLETVHLRESRTTRILRPTWNDGDPDPQPNRPEPNDPPDQAMRTVMSLLGV